MVASTQMAVESLEALPNRIHDVMDRHVGATPDRLALIDDSTKLPYRELDRVMRGVGTVEASVRNPEAACTYGPAPDR